MATWMDAHAGVLLAGWYVFSAVVSGMPAPGATSGVGYGWLYHTLHLLAGDLSHWLQAGPGTGSGVGSSINKGA